MFTQSFTKKANVVHPQNASLENEFHTKFKDEWVTLYVYYTKGQGFWANVVDDNGVYLYQSKNKYGNAYDAAIAAREAIGALVEKPNSYVDWDYYQQLNDADKPVPKCSWCDEPGIHKIGSMDWTDYACTSHKKMYHG